MKSYGLTLLLYDLYFSDLGHRGDAFKSARETERHKSYPRCGLLAQSKTLREFVAGSSKRQLLDCASPLALSFKVKMLAIALPFYFAPWSIQARIRPICSLVNGGMLALLSGGGM